jgi:hypothetical protein
VTHARDIWWTLDSANAFVSPGVNSRGGLVPSHGASRRRLGEKPHKCQPGSIPLSYVVPPLDYRGIPTKLRHASSRVPKDLEDYRVCLEEIRYKQLGAIGTARCDHFVHIKCFRRWKCEQVLKRQKVRCALCRRPWDSTPLCVLCKRNSTAKKTCTMRRYHP